MAFLSRLFKGKSASETNGETAQHGVTGPEASPAAVHAPVAAASSSVRAVLPNAVQPVNLRSPGARQVVSLTSAVVPPPTTKRVPSVRPPARKVTFPVPSSSRPMAASPQPKPPVSPTLAPPPTPEPAPVLEAPDVAVILEVGDFVDRVPPNLLSASVFDRHQKVEFRASELYSDLTKGRASVPASTIYAKLPAIFARPVTDTEDAEVSLPLQKLVEQLSTAFQTRADQVAEDNVGEIETPFLQVAKEDSERLSSTTGAVSGAVRPAVSLPAASVTTPAVEEDSGLDFPVRPAHRTGQISTISAPKVPLDLPLATMPAANASATGPINAGKRPPSTVRASVAGGKIRLSGPNTISRMIPAPVQPFPAPGAAVPPPPVAGPAKPSTSSQRIQLPVQASGPSPSLAVSKKTARIQIPPISLRAGGQPGGPGRPSVVTPPPTAVPVQPSPVSIRSPAGADLPVTFRSSPPPAGAKAPPSTFAPTLRSPVVAPTNPAVDDLPAPVSSDDRRIQLALAAVLQGVPTSALAVEPWTIDDSVRVSLPFAPIEKQLSHGRVSISMEAFMQALPESHRHVFAPVNGLAEIPLPLPEIFQNLPASALAIRADQVVEETGTLYPTPFSQKADEDAQRFGTVPTPRKESAPTAGSAVEAPSAKVPSAAPVVEEEAPAIRDIPLDLESPVDEPPASEVAALPAKDELSTEPVVEPPAAVEPTPIEEALAVLESTAPAAEPPAAHEPTAQALPVVELKPPTPVESSPAKEADSVLQTLFMTEEDVDAKAVVRLVCQLPGVNGCAVMFADGLRLAGNFPDGDAEGFSAMAPPFYKRTQNFVSELHLGGLKTFTIYTEAELLSFFMHDDICLSVRHVGRGFLPGVREKLESVTRALAGMYSTIGSPGSLDLGS